MNARLESRVAKLEALATPAQPDPALAQALADANSRVRRLGGPERAHYPAAIIDHGKGTDLVSILNAAHERVVAAAKERRNDSAT